MGVLNLLQTHVYVPAGSSIASGGGGVVLPNLLTCIDEMKFFSFAATPHKKTTHKNPKNNNPMSTGCVPEGIHTSTWDV